MSTSNFYYKNASKVFAIGLDYENEEGENVSCDEYEYIEQIENVQYNMELNKGEFYYNETDRNSQTNNRNFEASFIGSLSVSKNFGDVNVDVQINAFSRAGYYEGACLDWELELNVDSYSDDDIEGVSYAFEHGYLCSDNMNAGMLKIQAKNAQKWAKKAMNEIVELIEKSFEKSSTCFVRVATFSNGETIYKKCE